MIEIGSPETTRWYLKKKKNSRQNNTKLNLFEEKEMFQKNLQVCIFASYLFEPEREEERSRERKRNKKRIGGKNCLGKSKNGQGHLNKKIISIVKQVYSLRKEGNK